MLPALDDVNKKQGAFTMILKNFYKVVYDFINQNKQKIIDYKQQLKQAGGYNNFDLRLAFDCFYAHRRQATIQARQAGNVDFYFDDLICDVCNLDKRQGIKDNYIATLYKKVLQDCGLL